MACCRRNTRVGSLFELGVMNLIPKKIQPYFEITQQTGDRDNSIIEGVLTCCNEQDFEG